MSTKYTIEDFISDAIKIHGDKYDYSDSKYVNKSTKIAIKCNKCGNIFMQTPKRHLNGQGCPKCGAEYARLLKKNDYKTFLQKANIKYGNRFSYPYIENEYENNKKKITVKCNDCGFEFKKRPNDFLSQKFDIKCKQCKNKSNSNIISYEELKKFETDNKIEKFEGQLNIKNDEVTVICEKHGKYKAKISSIINGKYSCRKCIIEHEAKKRKISKEEFHERLENRFPNAVTAFDDEYVDTCTEMHFKCNKCGHVFTRTPNRFIFSNLKCPCPECSKKNLSKEKTKTTEEFIKDAIKTYGKERFSFDKTVYTKSNEKVKIKCNECGRYFEIEANSFLSGIHGCPYHNCNSSLKEKELAEFLSENGVDVIANDRKVLNGKELDLFIPEFNLAIEFDGIFWHNELYKDKNYHLNKTNECANKGVRLIHIFEDEWVNKKEIWKSILLNITHKTQNRIYARKCEIKEVSPHDSFVFLNENHIQGSCGSKYRYGLYYNNELVSLMTFGKSRHFIGGNKHQYELLRFCNKINLEVVGAASRLFKHFIIDNEPTSIVSYADRRWSIGNLYNVLGFKLYNISKPNYFYVIDNNRMNRFNFRKSVLVEKYNCPHEMSEREFCKSKKWWRIYDCGCLCFEWKK